ncbi:HEPN/Toprim-associated domain-containing protein [Paraburkholderia hospita]|uniref:HEPN/Toprim-associated domain-containing protein n=1 Tax=Paraburkholderia hospita TaxID=169430 RepID=UPI0002719C4B|nr:HEPN/Toprim-associated domain-containing protein [Paraburkholderia hospita]EUC18715.1 hypothetical protein PMI06_003091 [Burkholderia sp. BT03]SKC62250.1 hypothetical protein SAMN06266956_1249 [Paraburkholderia hospita]
MSIASISIGGSNIRVMRGASILIGGHVIGETPGGYRPWFFDRDDRVIRRGERREYLFATTAETLRQRLDREGYNRESLEREFREYRDKFDLRWFSCMSFETANTRARANTILCATLDDWLAALVEALRFYRSLNRDCAGPRCGQYEISDPFIDVHRLVECITEVDLSQPFDLALPQLPQHNGIGFPCTSLGSFAVAMLAVFGDDTECAFDVTDLVKQGGVYAFNDPLSRRHSRLTKPRCAS